MSEKRRTSLYLDETIIEKLRKLADVERRSMSRQVEFYVDRAWRIHETKLIDEKVPYNV